MSFSNPGYSPALQSAINWSWGQGVVMVARSATTARARSTSPPATTAWSASASTGIGDLPSMFSNTGPDVFLAAPGENILSSDTSGGV